MNLSQFQENPRPSLRIRPFKSSSARASEQHCRWTALSVSCPGLVFVRNFRKIVSGFYPDFRKKNARCLSVWPEKDETELSGFSLSLPADVWRIVYDLNISDTADLRFG